MRQLVQFPFRRKRDTSPSTSRGAAAFSELLDKLIAPIDWRPEDVRIPRSACYHATLPLQSIPKRMYASALRLQIINLAGLEKFGFAWRVSDETAEVWYWDESKLPLPTHSGPRAANGFRPIPEMLFRAPLADGIHLIRCIAGVEALASKNGYSRRSRWFNSQPSDAAWVNFVRDAGLDPAQAPLPAATSPASNPVSDKAWQIETTLRKKLDPTTWIRWGSILALSTAIVCLATYDTKQRIELNERQQKLATLRQEKAVVLDLQKRITENTEILDKIAKTRPRILQLQLMETMANTGLFAEGTNISLQEWEYRNDRLRLAFYVPKDNFSLGLFLATLEENRALRNIKLMPESTGQVIGIQATLGEYQPPPVQQDAENQTSAPEPSKQ